MNVLSSKIELYDAFTGPLMRMVQAAYSGMETITAMQGVLSQNVDTSALTAVQMEMQETEYEAQRLQQVLSGMPDVNIAVSTNEVAAPKIPAVSPVQVPMETALEMQNVQQAVNTIQTPPVSMPAIPDMQVNTAGLDAAAAKMQQVSAAAEKLNQDLQPIKNPEINIAATGFDSVQSEISNTESMAQQLNSTFGAVSSPSISIDTQAIQNAQNEIQQVNVSAEQLAQGFSEIEFPEIEANISGIELQETKIQALTASMNQITNVQQQINAASQNMAVVQPEAKQQLIGLNESIRQLEAGLNYLNSNPFNLDTGAAQAQIEALEKSIQGISNQQIQLQMQLPDVPVVQTPDIPPVVVPVQWETDSLPVFTNTGIERFEQEIQAAQAKIEKLTSKQAQITAAAQRMQILPGAAKQDLQAVALQIDAIRQRITQIQNNQLNIGTDAANNGLEQLRAQLDSAIQLQEQLNNAIETKNINAANAAYLQLSGTIGRTEQYIRDNVSAQGQFNAAIAQGQRETNSLMSMIKGAIGAYVSVRTIGSAINISDQFVNTTARISQMNDGMQTTDQLIQMIYQSAQNARGSFGDMAAIVARFGNNAKDAFSSSKEVIAFSNLIQKEMTIAGASTMEASNAMLQLSQALGSGVLRGDELNSIFEQAPNLIGRIADHMQIPIGQIRQMATEGKLSADVVKQAVFAAANDINDKFAAMPRTWGQIWQGFQNTALFAFRPVLQEINAIANSQGFQNFVNGAIGALSVLSRYTLKAFNTIGSMGKAIYDNWDFIAPVIYAAAAALLVWAGNLTYAKAVQAVSTALDYAGAVAKGIHAAAVTIFTNATWAQASATATATAAQLGLNTAMYACPVVWIVGAIIALVAVFYLAIAAVNRFAGTSISATGVICGAFMVALAFIGNLFVAAANLIIDCMVTIANAVRTVANFVATVFVDPVNAVIQLFVGMANTVLNILSTIAGVIDTVFGSNLSAAVNNWKGAVAEYAAGLQVEAGATVIPEIDASQYKLQRFDYGEAYDTGYNFGKNLNLGKMIGADLPAFSGMPDMVGKIAENSDSIPEVAGNTGGLKDGLEIKDEDLKYLRDLAEQEAINRYTTAEIHIDMTNNNHIEKGMDTSGFVAWMTDAVNEAIDVVTEGVHK